MDRLQEIEVRGELDVARFVPRPEGEVDDAGVGGVVGVEREDDGARDLLVGSRETEIPPREHELALVDLEPDDAGLGRRSEERRDPESGE